MSQASIRVLLVDDHQIARLGLAAVFETADDMIVVGQASDGIEGLELYRRERPDVVLSDLKMPRSDGVQLITALCAEKPPGRAVVLTQFEGDETVFRALKAGAWGYLTKDSQGDEILAAVRAVASGRRHVPGAIGAKLAARVTGETLTLRELQILQHLAAGQSNRDIAEGLRVAERTVAAHVASILAKLQVKNRAEAVARGIKLGMLE